MYNVSALSTVHVSNIVLKDREESSPISKIRQAALPIMGETATQNGKLPILISGAGIAGLALANALSNMNEELEPSQRIPFIIIERDDSANTRNQGYGLSILKSNVLYLKKTQVLPAINERMVTLTGGYKSYTQQGELLSLDLKEDASELKRVVARGEVREHFLERVGKVNVLWNTVVNTFKKSDEGILVSLTSNGKDQTMLVANLIACDGINSKIRKIVNGDEKKYLGVIGVFGRVLNAQAQKHLKHEFQVDDDKSWRMFSKPYNPENYNWQMFFPWEEKQQLPENKQILDYMVNELSSRKWSSHFIELLKCTEPDTMRSGLLYDRDPLSPLEGAGAVTLMGDAAHPLSPYKGRGANLALEGVQVFVQVAKEAIERASKEGKEFNWTQVNRTYEVKHWPYAGKVQLSCRQSVMEHHFSSTASHHS